MTSRSPAPCVLDLHEAASGRLSGIERFEIAVPGAAQNGSQSRGVRVALPVSYTSGKARKRRYPLLVVLDAQASFGSAVEMSRLMSETEEVHECIVVGIDTLTSDFVHASGHASGLIAALLAECRQRYRLDPAQSTLWGVGPAGGYALRALLADGDTWRNAIVCNPCDITSASLEPGVTSEYRSRRIVLISGPGEVEAEYVRAIAKILQPLAGDSLQIQHRVLDDEAQTDVSMVALVNGLRMLFATGIEYGHKVSTLHRPYMPALLGIVSPLTRRLLPKSGKSPRSNPHLFRADKLARDFEVFACLPASAAHDPVRRYPALLVLDANIEFATVAETAARMAAAGTIEEIVVIGLGTPRAEGHLEFGYRRFEEFAPPTEAYDFNDDLGRIFRSLFAMRGQDARQRLGLAPQLLEFIGDELLPQCGASLPIDATRLGLLGHSAGGTFVGFALAQRPELFRYYASISPGIAISGSWLMQQRFDGEALRKCGASVSLSVGELEMSNAFNIIAGIPETDVFAERVREQSGLPVRYRCFDGETHSSIYPRAVTQALSSFFVTSMPVS